MFLIQTEETLASDVVQAVEQFSSSYGRQFKEMFEGFPVKAAVFGIKVVVALLMLSLIHI